LDNEIKKLIIENLGWNNRLDIAFDYLKDLNLTSQKDILELLNVIFFFISNLDHDIDMTKIFEFLCLDFVINDEYIYSCLIKHYFKINKFKIALVMFEEKKSFFYFYF
jgi:hypothetical protein